VRIDPQHSFSKSTLNELLKEYASAAVTHGEATTIGDYRKANTQYDVIQAVYRELRSLGQPAQHALLGLLDHPEDAVKAWAASHALEFAPKEAEPVLEALSKSSSISGFSAEMTLKERRKGSLKFS
jgi:hypothetical protein